MNHAFAPAIARRLHRFLAPLQQALSVRERAFLFGVAGGGKEEDFRADFLGAQLAALDFGRVIPERGRLDLDHVAHDEPFQFRERLALEPRVLRPDRRVLPHDEISLPSRLSPSA